MLLYDNIQWKWAGIVKNISKQFGNFIEIAKAELSQYYKGIYNMIKYEHMKIDGKGKLLYPNMILFSQSEQHYICEVFGLSDKF